MDRVVATETAHEKRAASRGAPIVEAPPPYDGAQAASYIATRMPGTLATNLHVMTEAKRCLPHFAPKSILDFGAGSGVSVMAAANVFSVEPPGKQPVDLKSIREDEDGMHSMEPRLEDQVNFVAQEQSAVNNDSKIPSDIKDMRQSLIEEALLIDHSKPMRSMAASILPNDDAIGSKMKINLAESLNVAKIPNNGHDIVCASYSLGEIVRDVMVNAVPEGEDNLKSGAITRGERMKMAERRLIGTVKRLWSQTAPGGLFIVIENGTAAGFETIVFARETVLRTVAPWNVNNTSKPERPENELHAVTYSDETANGGTAVTTATGAKVIAPCIHSKPCPLGRSITRHRVCRFEQRYNRPPFQRNSRPLPTGYEDEFFSYIVIQKEGKEGNQIVEEGSEAPAEDWGRIVRPPLRRGKHIVLDACTRDGSLERRVVSKKNAPPGHYGRARRAKWGDIWPVKPLSKPQIVNF